jgi:hypothetical protein
LGECGDFIFLKIFDATQNIKMEKKMARISLELLCFCLGLVVPFLDTNTLMCFSLACGVFLDISTPEARKRLQKNYQKHRQLLLCPHGEWTCYPVARIVRDAGWTLPALKMLPRIPRLGFMAYDLNLYRDACVNMRKRKSRSVKDSYCLFLWKQRVRNAQRLLKVAVAEKKYFRAEKIKQKIIWLWATSGFQASLVLRLQ